MALDVYERQRGGEVGRARSNGFAPLATRPRSTPRARRKCNDVLKCLARTATPVAEAFALHDKSKSLQPVRYLSFIVGDRSFGLDLASDFALAQIEPETHVIPAALDEATAFRVEKEKCRETRTSEQPVDLMQVILNCIRQDVGEDRTFAGAGPCLAAANGRASRPNGLNFSAMMCRLIRSRIWFQSDKLAGLSRQCCRPASNGRSKAFT